MAENDWLSEYDKAEIERRVQNDMLDRMANPPSYVDKLANVGATVIVTGIILVIVAAFVRLIWWVLFGV